MLAPSAWREYLEDSWKRVKAKHGPPGSDGISIDDFEHHSDREIDDLADELGADAFRPYPYLEMREQKKEGGERLLVIPAVRDRVVASAVARILSERFDPTFSEGSFAYRPGRSIHDAWKSVDEARRRGLVFGWKCDVSKCFASIPLKGLYTELMGRDIVSSLLGAVQALLDARRTDGRKIWNGSAGLPEGLSISPLLCNLALDPLDKFLEWNDWFFARYADDLLLLASDPDSAAANAKRAEEFLFRRDLVFSAAKSGPVDFQQGFIFLGAHFLGTEVIRDGIAIPRSDSGSLVATRDDAVEETASFQPLVWNPEPPLEIEGGEELGDAIFLRTLYLEGQGTVLAKSGKRFVVRRGTEQVGTVPSDKIGQIILFPGSYSTTPAMLLAIKEDIPVTFIGYGSFGRLENTSRNRVVRERLQFLRGEDEAFSYSFASSCVEAKIANSIRIFATRNIDSEVAKTLRRMLLLVESLRFSKEPDRIAILRGHEGAAAAAYFDAWPELLQGTGFSWRGRNRRPPKDPINAMLSFGYTLLFYNIYSIIRLHGLNPYVGHLHTLREGHPALVSDFMEEWRAPIVDTVVLAMIRARQIKPEEFALPEVEGAACLMGDDARRRYIDAFERRMRTMMTHENSGYRVTYRRAVDLQVRGFIRYLDGRDESYAGFHWETK